MPLIVAINDFKKLFTRDALWQKYFIYCLLLIPTITIADILPDAGALEKQLQKNTPNNLLPEIVNEVEKKPEIEKVDHKKVIKVSNFNFEGNKIISSEQLSSLVKNYINKNLNFKEIREVAIKVANFYRSKGWVVKSYIPEQEIKQGVITIRIVESKFGKVKFDDKKSARISNHHLKKIIEKHQEADQPLNSKAIDRGLLIINDIPGINVSGNLTESDSKEKTDLSLRISDKTVNNGLISLDNHGSRSIGSNRTIASLKLHSPFAYGESVGFDYMRSQDGEDFKNNGSDYFRLALSAPVLYNGLRLGVNSSYFLYNLISSEFKSLNAQGYAKNAGFESSYPIIRSANKNLYSVINYDHKIFYNKALSVVSSDYYSDAITLGLNGNIVDNYLGGGNNTASINVIKGKLNLNKSPNFLSDSITTITNGYFNKFLFNVSRQQKITNNVYALIAFSTQISSKNLDSSEKFYLGGFNGVRAYPSNEAGGANGSLINIELHKKFKNNTDITAFYDFGKVLVNKNNNFSDSAYPNNYDLKGFGLSFGWQSHFGLIFKATFSQRIGKNPNPTLTGKDQDGSLIKNRFWISATMMF